MLAACDSASNVGEQETRLPVAVAHVVGYDDSNPSSDVEIDVRAMSELVLTGKESVDGDLPIVEFSWAATNDAAENALITIRNASTVAVSLPPVSVATLMEFTLTIRDSDENVDTATVTLNVQPALDANRFLQYPSSTPRFKVVAATGHALTEPVPFVVQRAARVTYDSRSGTRLPIEYFIGDPVRGSWLSSTDSAPPDAADARNPQFLFDIPSVNLDEITRQFQATLPGSAGSLADPALVDDAEFVLRIHLRPDPEIDGATLPNDATLFVLDPNGDEFGPAAQRIDDEVVLELNEAQVNQLRILNGSLENDDTATSYYNALDLATGVKDTLDSWLRANCFNPEAPNYGADAHAVYVNNYDLGFGRDMYFRTGGSCGSEGDVSAVVVNYQTLEGAAKKIDPILAVAMEFKASADPTRPGLVTFYAFAPEQSGSGGGFKRVKSVNFDGRGEKFLPGACTMCHGGKPKLQNGLDTYSTGVDIGATFLPWDVESLLFSDDAAAVFPAQGADTQRANEVSYAEQREQIKALNVAAYHTFGSGSGVDFECLRPHFSGACDLVELWYGGEGLPSEDFIRNKVAPGWNDSDNERDLYLDVFRKHCRACHVQMGADRDSRPLEQDRLDKLRFLDFAHFDTDLGAEVKRQVLNLGRMPGARLTMDRLWQNNGGPNTSAGDALAAHFGLDGTKPGRADASCFQSDSLDNLPRENPDQSVPESTTNRRKIVRGTTIAASYDAALCNEFAGSLSWVLVTEPAGIGTLKAEDGIRTEFVANLPGTYDLTLNAAGTREQQGGPVAVTRFAVVEDLLPSPRDLALPVNPGSSNSINVIAELLAIDPSLVGDQPSQVDVGVSSDPRITVSDPVDGVIALTAASGAGNYTATVPYSIIDRDGQGTGVTAVINVIVAEGIDARDGQLVSVSANSTALPTATVTPIELAITAPSGQVPQVANISSSSLGGNLAAQPGNISAAAACAGDPLKICVVFTPPAATITRFPSTSTRIRAAYTFSYQACIGGNCDDGSVIVEIDGQMPFATVSTMLLDTNQCSMCHRDDRDGSTWMLEATPPNVEPQETDAWCAVALPNQAGSEEPDPIGGGALYAGDALRTMINLAAPSESLLYVKPIATITHGGGLQLPPLPLPAPDPENALAKAIREWIGEGGAFTSGSSPTCP